MAIRLRHRKHGISYQIIIYSGYFIDKDGVRKQKRYSKTYQAPEGFSHTKAYKRALSIEVEFKNKIDLYKYNPENMLFKDLWDHYFNFYATSKLKKSTIQSLLGIVNKHILPFFESMRLNSIYTLVVSDFLYQVSILNNIQVTYKDSYKNTIRARLHAIFGYGVKIGWLNKNPCRYAYNHKSDSFKQQKFYTEYQIKDLYNLIKPESILDDILLFQLYTGLRIGETLALTWNDINFNESYIDINKTVNIIDGEFIVGQPKSRYSYRHIYITPFIDKLLKNKTSMKILFSLKTLVT